MEFRDVVLLRTLASTPAGLDSLTDLTPSSCASPSSSSFKEESLSGEVMMLCPSSSILLELAPSLLWMSFSRSAEVESAASLGMLRDGCCTVYAMWTWTIGFA